jgi:hypothetical protein
MTGQAASQGSFIQQPQVLTDGQLGLEEKKLAKEFRERLVNHLFSATFLVFLLVAALILAGICLLWSGREFAQIAEFWKWIVPLVTTFIGYAIGKQPNGTGEA